MNSYYVYVYYRLDTNEPFYVGMGHDRRWRILYNRNEYFKNIMNKTKVVCEIVKDNLTEEQAHGIECWLINELVFEYGFSINIPNNRSKEKGMHLVNCTWGGEGVSGCNPFENKTEEEMNEIKEKISKTSKEMWENNEFKQKVSKLQKGENNGMYGRHHTEKTKRKISEKRIGKYCGENSPLYGREFSEEHKRKISENHANVKGSNNPSSKAVICLTTKEVFHCIKYALEKYNIKGSSSIGNCCKGKVKSCGKLESRERLEWLYLDNFLEKCSYMLL